MNKQEFNTLLKEKLELYLPINEINKTLNFFNEIMDDRIDEGMSEEEAINNLGSIDEIVNQILEEHNITKRKTKMVWRFIPRKAPSPILLILGILLFPLWIVIISMIFSFFVIAISFIFSAIVLVISIPFGGGSLIIKSIFFFYEHNTSYGLASLGYGFILIGTGLLINYYIFLKYKQARANGWSIKKTFVKIFKKEVFIDE